MTSIVILLVSLNVCHSYRHGAPKSACSSLTPHHGHYQPQTKNPPYDLVYSRNTTTADWVIDLTLKGKSQHNQILGFLVQAREGDTPIGKFTVLDDDISQLLTCENEGVSY